MSKGLRALERVRWNLNNRGAVTSLDLDIIEKELKEQEQYKAIEKELGIDLITLFKIMKQLEINIELFSGDSYCLMPDGKTIETDMGYVIGFIIYIKEMIKNHGKTWTLTKEELL